jgi:hypothetical protein
MTLEFFGKLFDEYERSHNKAYLGFFSPDGNLVDYNTDQGTNHHNIENIVSWTFLLWIMQSDEFKNLGLIDISSLTCNEIYNSSKNNNEKNILLLQKDIINFLKSFENTPGFIKIIMSKIDISKLPNYTKDKEIKLTDLSITDFLGIDNTKELLNFLKDICVLYLGYDAIEQVKPNGKLLTFEPQNHLTYLDKPRIISTTHLNVNERFYNYLLMNYKLQKLPRYIFNNNTQKFEIDVGELNSFQSETDNIYEKEIESIKRLVPLKERPKYFR